MEEFKKKIIKELSSAINCSIALRENHITYDMIDSKKLIIQNRFDIFVDT